MNGLVRKCIPCKNKTPKTERNLPVDYPCCAVWVCSQEPDFREEQREWLTEVVLRHNCRIIYYPKYHCELNFIEMIWGWIKAYHRKNCTYHYEQLKAELPETVFNRLPIAFIRKAMRHTLRFMDGYRFGLTGALLDFTVVRKYKSHRRIPETVTLELARSDFETAEQLKLSGNKRKR